MPIGAEDGFRGVVDLIEDERRIYWDDESLGAEVREERDSRPSWPMRAAEARGAPGRGRRRVRRRRLASATSTASRSTADQLRKADARAARSSWPIVPVFCGAAFKNKGVQPLLDGVVDYLPSPLDVPPVEGHRRGRDEPITRKADDDEPFAALAFKIMTDPHVGQLTYLPGLLGRRQGRRAGAQREPGPQAAASAGCCRCTPTSARSSRRSTRATSPPSWVSRASSTGDTLCDPKHPILLESMQFPEPVISIAIEPKTKADKDKLWASSLERLADEDPTFQVAVDDETGQTIISGMGELHLEIIVDRLLREFKVGANVGRPQVAYRETITEAVKRRGPLHQADRRCAARFGVVKLEVEPGEPGSGFVFENRSRAAPIPKEYIPAVEAGLRGGDQSGPLAGYPVVDVKVTLLDGAYHEVDSSERSFKIAGSLGHQGGASRRRSRVLLEPIMNVEVVTPEEFMGASSAT